MSFVLVIHADDLDNMTIDYMNESLTNEAIILYTETWLEHFKEQAKQPIRESLS